MSTRGEPGTVYTLHFDPPYRPSPDAPQYRSRYNPNLSANWRRDYDRPRTRNVTTGAAQLAGSDPRPDQNRMEGTDHDNDYHVPAVEG
jgi:hypothetical protein